MRFNRSYKEKYIVVTLAGIATFFLVITFITLMLNINANKGVIPLIFLFLSVFYISLFFYNLFYLNVENKAQKNQFKSLYLVLFLISLLMFFFSYISLWK